MSPGLLLCLSCIFAFAIIHGQGSREEAGSQAGRHVQRVELSPGRQDRKGRPSGEHAQQPQKHAGVVKHKPAGAIVKASRAVAMQQVRSHLVAMNAQGAGVLSVSGNSSSTRGSSQSNRSTKQPDLAANYTELPSAVQALPDMDDGDFGELVDNSTNVSDREMLIDLAGGTGATLGGTGNLSMDKDLVRRMRYQDKAVMLLLLVMYFVVLGFSASFSYRQALNDSPVTFYADPRYHTLVCEGHDRDNFLESFNQSPKAVQLQVTGFVPVPAGGLGSIEWQGEYYYDAFSFALDLSPWIVRDSTPDGSSNDPSGGGCPLIDGVVAQDMQDLNAFIDHNHNELAMVELRKEVSWKSWEELATNIKHKIRQSGFNGIISVRRTECDSVTIFQNTAWANFMHSRTTKVLCALSVVGWMFYVPYMWMRCSCTVVRARYKVDISIDAYWNLIVDKLSRDGFVEDPNIIPQYPAADVQEGSAGADGLPIQDLGHAVADGPIAGGALSQGLQAPEQFHAYDIYDAADLQDGLAGTWM